MKKLIGIILLSFSILASAGESTGTPTSASFTAANPVTTRIANPDKGIATYIGGDFVTGYNNCCQASNLSTWNSTVMFCPVSLSSFATSAISSTWLSQLTTSFANIRAAGLKCMMDWSYDNFSGGNDTTMTWIKYHLNQLAPILNANADVIAIMRGGFIGEYGESWGSVNGNSCGYAAYTTPSKTTAINCTSSDPNYSSVLANRVAWRNALLAAVHPYTVMGVRYPTDTLLWYPTALTSSQAFDGSPQSRIGQENNCALSSSNDSGTWNDTYGSGLSATQIQNYIAQTSNWTGYFGELSTSCSTPLTTDCPTSIAYFQKYHATVFKMIISGGSPGSWTGDASSYVNGFYNGGCLTQISNLLGYWLQLNSASHQSTANRGDSITVNVRLQNLGFGRFLTPRKLVAQACLVASPNTCYTGTSSADLRELPPQDTQNRTMAVHITIPSGATTGAYQIRLSVPDIWSTTQSRPYMVQFGNANGSGTQAWNDAGGYMVTGTTLTVN